MEVSNGRVNIRRKITTEGWVEIKLGNCFDFKNGLNKEKKYFGYGTPIVNYMDVYKNRGLYKNDILGKVFLAKEEIKNYEVQKGDVLFTRTSETVDEIGISSVILEEVIDTVFSGFVLRARPKNDKLGLGFKKYCFSTKEVRKEITSKSSYTTRALTNGRLLSDVIILMPSNQVEQAKIAQALSDIDELISSLKKLIKKKRLIKQGAMQQLLTGKKRLPRFSEKWEVKKLGEIGDITGAGIDKKIRPNEISVRLVNYLDVYHKNFIYSKHLNHWVTAPEHQAQRCRVKKGDIFFTPSSETPDDIGISSLAVEDIEDAGYSYHVVRLRLIENWDFNFRAYIFKTRFFLDQAEKFCEGSGKRYVISLKRFRELGIFYPDDRKEQESISSVLKDIDLEIESLEQKLFKYKSIKQGMMQVLLTGKIRLV